MKFNKYFTLIIFFIFIVNTSICTNIDSLKNKLSLSENKEKMFLLEEISDYYYSINSLDSCFDYASEAMLLAKKYNVDSIIANSYNKMGMASHYKGNNTKAIDFFNKAIEKYQSLSNKKGLAGSYTNIGVVLYSNKEYKKAINSYKHAIKLFKELNEYKYLATIYYNIGLIYQQTQKPDIAIEYFEKSIELQKQNNDLNNVYNTLSSISLVYRIKGEYKKALENYYKILDYSLSIKDNRKTAITYLDIGECLFEQKKYTKAIETFNKGLKYSKLSKLNNLTQTLYLALSELYEKTGNKGLALKYYKLYSENKEASQNNILYKDLENKIALVKDEKLKVQQELENYKLQRQKNINYILFGAVILFLITSIIILYQIKIHRKKNKELRNLLKIISESERQLTESNNTKDKFFSIIAHDIKNPLNAFISVTNFLIEETNNIDKEKHLIFLNKMKNSADYLNNLLENLLSWAKSQMNKIEFYPELFDINIEINNIINLNKSFADNKQIKIINNINTVIDVFADINLIKTILRNIISNAIKFTNKGGNINIFAKTNENNVEIHIKDNGIGMPDDILENLFKLKIYKSESDKVNGSGNGLGLVLCDEFIKINNGEIKVYSEFGKGSDFVIILPKNR